MFCETHMRHEEPFGECSTQFKYIHSSCSFGSQSDAHLAVMEREAVLEMERASVPKFSL